jgi:hypothetical protein
MENPSIPTHRTDELRGYFDSHFKRPRTRWLPTADAAAEVLSFQHGPISIGPLTKVIRLATTEQRYRTAAWHWLRPEEPSCRIEELPYVQRAAGLDHVSRAAFVPRLQERCLEEMRRHPRLKRWIQRRMALLDFVVAPPVDVPEEVRDMGPLLRALLLQATALLGQGDRAGAGALAAKISVKALSAAAAAVKRILGTGDCHLSANIMIPTVLDSLDGPRCVSGRIAQMKSARAAQLWQGFASLGERCLLIVAETEDADHMGFWIPIRQGQQLAPLPGAPEAFDTLEGSAVFKDDLPDLSAAFSPTINSRWHAFMTEHFKQRMFVSLPLRLPAENAPTVGAVLNVNAAPTAEDGWRRAYHPVWLRAARDRAGPFIEAAYFATLIRREAEPAAWPRIDTGARQWDTLPGAGPHRLLP